MGDSEGALTGTVPESETVTVRTRAMASAASGRLFVALGVLALAHSAYSTIQYREELKLRHEEFEWAPADVLFELLVGLLLCVVGAPQAAGDFQPIRPTEALAKTKFDSHNSRPDFFVFEYR